MTLLKRILAVAIAGLFVGLALEADSPDEALEAGRRYREALALAESIPGDVIPQWEAVRRAAPDQWKPNLPVTSQPRAFLQTAPAEEVSKLEQALDLLRRNAAAGEVDWGRPWDPFEPVSTDYRVLRQLSHLGVVYHDEKLNRGEHDHFVGDMVALVRAARHFGSAEGLGACVGGTSMERTVTASIARNAARLPPEAREELVRLWRTLPPPASPTTAFLRERAAFRSHLWDVFAGTADPSAPPAGGMAERLRVSSIVAIGGEVWGVGFEDAETGGSFRLRPGGRRGELELVWVDLAGHRALVRQRDETAIVALAARSLFPIDLDKAWERFSSLLVDGGDYPEDLLAEDGGNKLAAFEALLAQVDLDTERQLLLLRTSHAELPEMADKLDAEAFWFTPTLWRIRHIELTRQAGEELLLTGLEYLKNPLSTLPVSEVTDDPIRRIPDDEALILESSLPIYPGGPKLRIEFPLR